MAISPMGVGDILPVAAFTIQKTDGTAQNLTSATFTLTLTNQNTNAVLTGAGTFTITDATNGKVQYAWNAADTATAGPYLCRLKITLPGGQTTAALFNLTIF